MTRHITTALQSLAVLGKVVAVIGAGCALYGVSLPWAQTKLFGALPIALPGYFYALGGLALTGAICAVLLLRYPLAIIAGGLLIVYASAQAFIQIPHAVRGQILGAQIAFAPLNRLLDQFHIENITVGNYGARDDALLGTGVSETSLGGWLVMAGGLVALPCDPLLLAARLRWGRQRCRSCGARWPLRRNARHCPVCGVSTMTGKGMCSTCGQVSESGDHYCVSCGTEFS